MRRPSATSRPTAAQSGVHPGPRSWRARAGCWNCARCTARAGSCSPVPARSTASSRRTCRTSPKTIRARRCPPTPARPTARASASRNFSAALYAQVYGFDAVIAPAVRVRRPVSAAGRELRHRQLHPRRAGGRADRGSTATARRTARICTRRTWRSGCGRFCCAAKPARAYNVGSAHELTIADLARCVSAVIAPGAEIRIARQPVPGVPASRYVPATDRAAALGLHPWISLEDGVRRTCDWHRRG